MGGLPVCATGISINGALRNYGEQVIKYKFKYTLRVVISTHIFAISLKVYKLRVCPYWRQFEFHRYLRLILGIAKNVRGMVFGYGNMHN